MPHQQASRTPIAATYVTVGDTLPTTFPARKPRTAGCIGAASWTWGPGNDRTDRYYLSSDRARRHWLLWLEPGGEDGSSAIGAWCPRQGLNRNQAAHLLLRTFWEGENAGATADKPGAPAVLKGADLLGTRDMRRLAEAVWPGEVV